MRAKLSFFCTQEAFANLVDSDIQGPVNIASGRPVSVKEIVQTVAAKLDGDDLIRFGAVRSAASEPPLLVGDTARLSQELNWQPSYSLDRGLDETITWWKHRLAGSDCKVA